MRLLRRRTLTITIAFLTIVTMTLSGALGQILPLPPGVVSVVWSPDGSKIAGGGTSGLLRVWDAINGNTLIDIPGLTENVLSVTWSPDSSKIASGSEDGGVRIWNVNDPQYAPGQLIVAFSDHQNRVLSLVWSPDGTKLAGVSFSEDQNLKIWDTTNYQLLATFPGGDEFGLAWSPDGSQLALANAGGGAYVVNVSSNIIGDLVNRPVGIRSPMASVAWSPDGSKLASGEFYDGNVFIWDAASGNQLRLLAGHIDEVGSLSWSPDGQRLASASIDDTVRVWDVNTGELLDVFQNDDVYVRSIAWSPDGKQLTFGRANTDIEVIQFPTADAGPDQTVPDSNGDGSELVTLDGSGSFDPDGTIVSYDWSEGGVSIASGVTPQVSLSVGVHTITLTVTDDDGATDTDDVIITTRPDGDPGIRERLRTRKDTRAFP